MYIPTLYTGNKVGIIQVGSKEGKPMFFFTFQISIQSTDSIRGRFQCGHVCSNPSARTSTDLKVERDVCLSAVVANREA
jgi:hypothetical protein